MSFRREKYIPRGGPDGGNGGHGGSVYLRAASGLNTLADFRVQRRFRALNGEPGAGQNRTGLSGEDLFVDVPVGTIVKEVDTQEILGDLDGDGNVLLVARGGRGGLGNTRFKSSVNRAPRQSTPGEAGEARHLALELKVLADVGLVGMPNAGKSTLIRALSAARPKVADYPFTTLHPHLGVVRVEDHRSFVMADIPGLIQGAAEGAGLGHQFLRHLERTRLLLHLVDAYPLEGGGDPSTEARAIEAELAKFSEQLGNQPRWLVLNKLDLFPENEQQSAADDIVQQLGWTGPVYAISALTGNGTTQLAQDVMVFLESAHMAEADV